MRNFAFKHKHDHNLINPHNMMLYKTVFKLPEDFLKLVGPEKVDFDKRYMVVPPDKVKNEKRKQSISKNKSTARKKMDGIIEEDKRYIKNLFNEF